MGERGLHKALNEYYKLSASQRNMRMCGMRAGGAPGLMCTLLHSLLIPQLPAALSPPALLGALGWLLFTAAWLLYHTTAVTIPLALWLVFAADGRLALGSSGAAAVEAAARLHPAAGAAMARMQAVAAELPAHPAAAALLALGLLVALRAAEGAVLRRRQERWELRQRRITAADVQARYSAWALPGSSSAPGAGNAAAATAAAAARRAQRREELLDVLRGEVRALWHTVYGGESLPADQLQHLPGVRCLPVCCLDTAPTTLLCGQPEVTLLALSLFTQHFAAAPLRCSGCLQMHMTQWPGCAGTLVWSHHPPRSQTVATCCWALFTRSSRLWGSHDTCTWWTGSAGPHSLVKAALCSSSRSSSSSSITC
jgi:hypothetical protein